MFLKKYNKPQKGKLNKNTVVHKFLPQLQHKCEAGTDAQGSRTADPFI
jgi:hypothetical protein